MGHGRHICPQDPTLGVNHLFGTSKVIGDAQVLEPAGGGDVDPVIDHLVRCVPREHAA